MTALIFTGALFLTMLVPYLFLRITPKKIQAQLEKEKKERHDYADQLIAKIPEHESTI